MIFCVVFVQEVVLQNYKQTTGSLGSGWYGYEHVCCFVDWCLFFSDDCVHAEIHFVVNNGFFYDSCVDDGLFILDLSVVHFKTNEHGVVATGVETDEVDADAVGFVGLAGWVNDEVFFFALHNVYELLFFDGGDHDGSSFGIGCEVVAWDRGEVPGMILLQPDLPKVY